ncbi:MAG TPA: hypothetical protein VF340_01100 [Methyloceanibacter sp.]|jgi:hypothetical protein
MARSATQRKSANPQRIDSTQRRARFAVGVVSVQRHAPSRVRFCALDGPVRVVIEADSELDARCLCRDMGFEFIGLCD